MQLYLFTMEMDLIHAVVKAIYELMKKIKNKP